ncbi:MAG: nucleotide exchange factor GrpE [Anaerolineae bacterium]|nr:nucleotide exchange factor GrpE [Anaerolineae bacterium]
MTQKKSLSEKINSLIFGEPPRPVNERAIHQKLDAILAGLNGPPTATTTSIDGPEAVNGDLAEQVRKLAKTQFKTNTLQEKQLGQVETALESLQTSLSQLRQQQTEQQQQAIEAAQLEMLKSLLPVLDSLDAAFENGRRQILKQPLPPDTRRAVVAWLDGVRLARLRLLDVLQAHQIRRIPTVGQPFDPHQHVAVATDSSGKVSDDIIVSEDRPGYASPTKVLRFAEVVVSKK